MDDVMNRMARELSDAIAAAVAEDPRVEACRERVRGSPTPWGTGTASRFSLR